MTATSRNPLRCNLWTRQAACGALACLLLPKCIACLHLHAWAVAAISKTQRELCGPTAVSWNAFAFDLAIVAACFALWQARKSPFVACSACPRP